MSRFDLRFAVADETTVEEFVEEFRGLPPWAHQDAGPNQVIGQPSASVLSRSVPGTCQGGSSPI